MTLRALLATCLLLACSALAPRAMAQATCVFLDQPGLAFGSVPGNPTTASSVTTSVRVSCTSPLRDSTAKVCLKLSNGSPDPALLPRRMANGPARLSFQVYRDSAGTQVLGNGAGAEPIDAVIPLTGAVGATTGTATFNIYGRLLAGQSGMAPGAYASDMSLTLTGGFANNAACNALNNVQAAVGLRASANIGAACTLVASPLDFGVVNTLTANIDRTTSLGLNCTTGAPYLLRMNGGTVAGNPAARRMGASGVAPGVIDYQLRHSGANGPLWGDGTPGTTVLPGTGTGTSQTVTVYGRVPGGQPPAPVGTYSDTVTVSVEY